MKLTTIRMINSANYSIANLKLDRDSIQIAGRNNKGKTSLLRTLLFLFVVDRKKIMHRDYGSEESLNFYFRNPESSYIVFEGFDKKQGYFYLLLKRDGKKIKYFFVKKKFEETFLIKESGQIRKFTEVIGNPHTGLEKPLKDVSEILAKVITSKKNEVGFLRLQKNISSRRFGDLYKHLFEVGNTSSDILKDGILVSLGFTEEKIDFAREIGYEEMAKWRREFNEIANLKVANQKYEKIKEKKRIFEESRIELKLLAISCESIDFETSIKNISLEEIALQDKLSKYKSKLEKQSSVIDNIGQQKEEASKNRGIKESEQEQLRREIELAESYEDRSWIKSDLKNREDDRRELEKVLENIEVMDSSKEDVLKKLNRLKKEYNNIVKYIDNKSDLLLLNISDNKEDIALMNALLSDNLKNLPKERLLHNFKRENNKNILTINSAKIDISDIKPEEIPTKEEKEREKRELEKKIKEWKSTLEAIEDKVKKENELEEVKKRIFDLNKQLEAIDTLPKWKKMFVVIEEEIKKYTNDYKEFHKELEREKENSKKLENDIEIIETKLQSLETIKKETFDFSQLFSKIKREISLKKELTQILSSKELDRLYQDKYANLEDTLREVEHKYNNYLELIELTRKDLKGMEDAYVEEGKFLEWLGNKCYRLEQKEKNLESITLAKKNLFIQTIKHFIEKLDNIRTYINTTNRLISNYTISDLSKVQIQLKEREKQLKVLDEIANTDKGLLAMLEDENRSRDMDNIFLEYIRREKIIYLSDLFEIRLNREKAGKKETSKQSNGTEKMLRVMLLLILMRGMINSEDTIPFLIDEIADIDDKNQVELLNFFKRLNLLPISASPKISHEFEKVYHIEEIEGKSYLNDETATRKVFDE
jgi:hypothetical protein